MRLMKTGLLLGTVAMLGTAAPALADETVRVDSDEPHSTLGIVAKDSLYGGLAGAAVGGGILLIQNDGWNGRTFGLATGIGLLAGAGLGVLDAASQHRSYSAKSPASDRVSRPEDDARSMSETGLPPSVFSLQKAGEF